MNLQPNEAARELLAHDRFLIITHKKPDGDTLGAAGALCSALRRSGKVARLYRNPEVTEKYVGYVFPFFFEETEPYMEEYVVSVDVSAEDMMAKGFSGSVNLCIDHHASNPMFGEINCVNAEKASCSEIILEIIKEMSEIITPQEADMLYIGVSTDCGCFQYGNTTSETHLAAAELIAFGADVYELNRKLFAAASRARLALEGIIYSGLESYHDGEVILSVLTRRMLEETGVQEDDLDSVAALPGKVETARLSAVIRELPDGFSKISVRTVKGIPANEICAAFGGGGHPQASGCTIREKPEKARQMLLDVIDKLWNRF